MERSSSSALSAGAGLGLPAAPPSSLASYNHDADASFDDQEKEFMSFMNFTEEMYEVIQDDYIEPSNQLNSHCMDSMDNVGQSYRMVHGYISLIVCVAGIFMNILIIMVLTRREMRTPINRMLTALATADIIVMLEYIPFTLHMYVFDLPEEQQYSYPWAVFVLFHSHLTQILHTINIQLTISMSIWRYLALKGAGNSAGRNLTLSRCNLCILAAYICPIIICIPNYLTFSIYHREKLYLRSPYDLIFKRSEIGSMAKFLKLCEHTGEIMNIPIVCESAVIKRDWYTVGLSKLAKANGESLHRINFWIFSVCVKIIPCIVLTTFMVWLLKTLYDAKKRHKMLQGQKPTIATRPSIAGATTPTTVNNHQHVNGLNGCVGGGGVGGRRATTDGSLPLPKSMENGKGINFILNEDNGVRTGTRTTPTLALSAGSPVPSNDHRDGHDKRDKNSTENNNGCVPQSMDIMDTKTNTGSTFSSNSNSVLTRHGSCNGHSLGGGGGGCVGGKNQLNGSCTNPPSILRASSVRVGKSMSNEVQLSFPIPFNQQMTTINAGTTATATTTPTTKTQILAAVLGAGASSPNTATRISKRKFSVGAAKTAGKRHTDRTSKLLIAVLCLFLLTEIPQGIMALLSGIYGEQFFRNCYNTWAEVWDILALINSAINFILYCFMSKQFRLQFRSVLKLDEFWKFSSKQPSAL